MAYTIQKVDVWAGTIEDRPGGLAGKLEALAAAGAELEFVIARRAQPGTGVAFVAPLKGAKQTKAAAAAGLAKAASLQSLRLEGPDKPGLGAKITRALADAGINVRGISAAALGKRCVVYFAFDSADDAKKAQAALKKSVK
ncbi:MAG: ACT domain-containing protein [Candidatus Hydrogenedentes bacterium]|nr:ACT domain-containing protein [Candidatus Hydrogenedentota bacterium]